MPICTTLTIMSEIFKPLVFNFGHRKPDEDFDVGQLRGKLAFNQQSCIGLS